MRERAVTPQETVELKAEIGDVPDERLVERTRGGDRRAFAELWRRHYRSGITVARSFTTLDADDLVSESFARIYKRTLEGGGPRGSFRPYLYTTIRNLASTWGTQRAKHVNVDELDDFEPTESAEEPVARSLDRTLTVQAYRSLPARWQTVLWYTEVEGLDPAAVAPILGMSANGVAALSYRAREGLRKAWLQAHVSDAAASGTCAWVLERVGEHARRSLTERETQKLESHLAVCARCSVVSEEVDDVGARLAMVMIPLLLGGVVGGTLLAASASGGSAMAATLASGGAAAAAPALPAGIGVAGGVAGGVAAGATATSSATLVAIAASTIVVAAAGVGGVALVDSHSAHSASATSSTASAGALADPLGIDTGSSRVRATSEPPASTAAVDPASTDVPVVPSTSAPTTTTPPTTATTPPKTTTDVATDPGSTKSGSADSDSASNSTVDSTSSTATDSAGKKVAKVVTTTTDDVGTVVTKTTGTVDKVVAGTTDTVDKVVDAVLPPGSGLTGTLNSKVDSVTTGLNGTVTTLTGTVDSTVGATTGLVGGLVGGLLGGH